MPFRPYIQIEFRCSFVKILNWLCHTGKIVVIFFQQLEIR